MRKFVLPLVVLVIAANFTNVATVEGHPVEDCTAAGVCNHLNIFAENTVTVIKRSSYSTLPANWQSRLADATVSWPISTGRPTLNVSSSTLSVSWCNTPNAFLARINVARAEIQGTYTSDPDAGGYVCQMKSPTPAFGRYILYRSDLIIDNDPGTPGNYPGCDGGVLVWWTSFVAPPEEIGPSGNIICNVDLKSVLVHELGHAMGFSGHFGFSTDCPASNPQTMCDSLAVNSSVARTTETHDNHVQDAGYA